MSESVFEKKKRVRPPRVNITYEVEIGGAQVMKELPFVVGVISDLSGQPKESLGKLKDRKFVEIDRDNFDDVLKSMKPRVALYVGGMGHRDKNFHKEMMIRRGFGDAAQKIQELFLAKRKDEAVTAVPDEFCDEMALVGPVGRIRERYKAWADSGITGLTISTEQTEAMELMASLAGSVR